ncbi:TPA: hypothetical protein ACP2RL_000289 [Escherichia coli]
MKQFIAASVASCSGLLQPITKKHRLIESMAYKVASAMLLCGWCLESTFFNGINTDIDPYRF